MEELDGESNKDIHGIKGDENESENRTKKCPDCGLNHRLQPRKKCFAYGSVCLNCQKENHWTRVCRSSEEDSAFRVSGVLQLAKTGPSVTKNLQLFR